MENYYSGNSNSNSNNNISTSVTPASAGRGDQVLVSACVKDIGEVKNVIISVPQYGITQIMDKQADGTYLLSYCIPWDAYTGSYTVQVNVTGQENVRLASSTFVYTVK